MPIFDYRARASSGQLIDGSVEAANSDMAAEAVRRRDAIPLEIVEQTKSRLNRNISLSGLFGRVSISAIIMFCRQMYALNKAGIPILRAIHGLADGNQSPVLQAALVDIAANLEQGRTLSTAMNNHKKVFSPLFISMIHVGENTGKLEEVFLRLSIYYEREQETKKQIKQATRYPLFVVVAISIAMVILNIFVIPQFAAMFSKFGVELPWATQTLLAVSGFFVSFWWLILFATIAFVVGFSVWKRSPNGKISWDRFKLRVPIFGDIIERGTLARYGRSFALTLSAGVPLTTALSLVAEAVDNAYMAGKIIDMRRKIESGESLLRASLQSEMFTPLVIQMVSVGEETGRVAELLTEMSEYYEREVDYDIKTLSARLEPVLIALVAVMVLIMALGIFTPMWDILSAYQGGR